MAEAAVRRIPGSNERADPGVDRARRIARLVFLARLLDSSMRVPGTRLTVGIDPILGLIPGIGDVLSAAVSCYIVYEAHKLGAPRAVLARMAGNVLIDFLIGEIPLLGDLFDFGFKANVRNLRLMGIEVGPQAATR